MDIISPSVTKKVISNSFTTAPAVGATLVNGSGTATGSPITLAIGANTIPITGAGTFTITLPAGCYGVAASGTATVTGGLVALFPGVNTIAVGAGGLPGNIIVTLTVDNYLVTIPGIQVGYLKRLTVDAGNTGIANLVVEDEYTPDPSENNQTPAPVIADRYPIYITANDWIDIDGHTISKHMGSLAIRSDTAGVVVGYVLSLE